MQVGSARHGSRALVTRSGAPVLTSFAGGRLFGSRSGEGSPNVLALHGWGGSHRQMAGVVENFDAIALDLPGFGASPPPDAVWGAGDYARAIAPVLDDLDTPAVIVGFSFGGRVAVNLAAAQPERVKALVLTGVPLLRKVAAGKPALGFRLLKKAHALGLVSEKRMEAERRKRGSVDYRRASGVMRDVLVRAVNESYEAELPLIRCPVALVWGENDTDVPLAIAEQAQTLLEVESTLTVVPGTTHFLPVEKPEAVREAVKTWR